MSNILASTYDSAIAVTTSDTVNDPSGPFAGFYTGGGGNITVVTIKKETALFVGTPGGTIIPVAILRVNSTGTAASGVLGLVANPFKKPAGIT